MVARSIIGCAARPSSASRYKFLPPGLWLFGMMINHSTLDCHVTSLTRSLAGPERLIDTLTFESDPNPILLTQSLKKTYTETLTRN